jgi:hypothetical protein
VTATPSSDPDIGGYVVFYSSTTGFDPKTAGAVVLAGTLPLSIYGLAAGTYYARIAAYDPWTTNPDLLNLSSEVSFTITTGGGTSPRRRRRMAAATKAGRASWTLARSKGQLSSKRSARLLSSLKNRRKWMQFIQFQLADFSTGAAIPLGKCAVYLAGTSTPAALYDQRWSVDRQSGCRFELLAQVGFAAADGQI